MARQDSVPPMQAQDKLAFLLSLVPYLIERERVSVTEAAAHLGVRPEQIRQAVSLLTVSGVPGETNTYQSEDLFDIAWDDFELNDQIVLTHLVAIDESPRFSAREAAAFIAGLQYLTSLPENADREAVSTLMSKLTRGASAVPSQVAVGASETDATLAVIRAAVEHGNRIEIGYLDSRGVSERRTVDPLRVESVDSDWYLRGWCHLREAIRTFRLDRITDISVSDEPMSTAAADVTLPDTLFEASADDLLVTIDVMAAAEGLIADYIPDGAVREESNGRVRTTIRVSHFHGLKRLISGMPGLAFVVEPPEARDLIAEWAATAAKLYESSDD